MATVKYSGPIASFRCPTNAEIRSLKVHFSPKQEGSGDPSPDNVRPIVGWDGVIAGQSGNNCINESFLSDASNYTVPGQYAYIYTEYLYLAPNTKYRFVWFNTNDIAMGYANLYCDGAGEYIVNNGRYRQYPNGFTTDETGKIRFGINKSSAYNTVQEALDAIFGNGKLLLQVGVEDIPYEPYHGSTTNYEFGVLGKNKFPAADGTRSEIFMKKDVAYTLSATSNSLGYFRGFYEDGTDTGVIWLNDGNNNNRYWKTYIPQQDIIEGSFFLSTGMTECQIELGSTATAYEPYDPNHTVYGGWVDLVSGEVCEEYSRFTPDENSNITVISGGTYKQFRFWDAEAIKTRLSGYCSHFKLYANPNGYGVTALDYLGTACQLILQQDSSVYVETVADLKSWLQAQREAGTPFHIVFERAEPNYYHLPPHSTQLQTFLGQNNVWSNADYVEVEYDLHETQDILARKQFIIANQPHVESKSETLAHFKTDISAPLKECKVHFSPVQEGEGDPSPENVRPISGWNNVDVTRCGKNLFDISEMSSRNGVTVDGNTFVGSAEAFRCYGQYSYGYGGKRTPLHIPQNIPINISCTAYSEGNISTEGAGFNPRFYYENKDSVRPWYTRNTVLTSTLYNGTITPTDDIKYYDFTWYNYAKNIWHVSNMQFEIGSEMTEYEPYTGTTIPITFPSVINILTSTSITANKTLSAAGEETSERGMSLTDYIKVNEGDTYKLTFTSKEGARTRRIWSYNANKEPIEQLASTSWVTVDTVGSIQATIPSGAEYIRICYKTADENIFLEGPESSIIYGGYVDLVTGEVWKTHEKINLQVAAKQGTWDSTTGKGAYWYTSAIQTLTTLNDGVFCNRCKVQNSVSFNDTSNVITWYTNSIIRWIDIGTMEMTVAEYRNYLAENPLQVTYKLNTPVLVTTLTPTQLKTLKGINNIWSDANGPIEVKYWTH